MFYFTHLLRFYEWKIPFNKPNSETSLDLTPRWNIWTVHCAGSMVKEANLTYSWSIQQPPTPNQKPHCSRRSLPLFLHHLYPLLPPIPILFLTPHLPCPLASPPPSSCSSHEVFLNMKSMSTLPVWLCQISDSFDSVSVFASHLSICFV